MQAKQLYKLLPRKIIKENEPLKNYTTFNIGGETIALLEPRTKQELIKCVKACRALNVKWQVIGNGSNLLASSKKNNRVIIVTTKMQFKPRLHQSTLTVSSGTMVSQLVLWCAERGLSGLENLYGIPATIGGMVMMNAGAFGFEMSKVIENIEVFDGQRVKILPASAIEFSHHKTSLLKTNFVVLSVDLKVSRLAPSVIYSKIKEICLLRREKQPLGKSAGSVFRQVDSFLPAGLLIDKAGLKGAKVGGAVVSEKHANFIINEGFATDSDVKNLVLKIEKTVKEKFDIVLEREIEYIGDRDEYNR